MNAIDAPVDTLNYMILGYAVILGCVILYIASLALRFRHLRRELEVHESIAQDDRDEPTR
jgi:hypothetical protein